MPGSLNKPRNPNDQNDKKNDEKKGMSGLLRSLLLKEPSGLALAKAQQAQHKKAA